MPSSRPSARSSTIGWTMPSARRYSPASRRTFPWVPRRHGPRRPPGTRPIEPADTRAADRRDGEGAHVGRRPVPPCCVRRSTVDSRRDGRLLRAGMARARRVISPSVAHAVGLLAVYVVVIVWRTWPLAAHVATHVPDAQFDAL